MSDLQNTEEWHQARLGKLTASRFSDAVARTRNGWGACRERYLGELVVERLTGVPYPHFVSREMQDGTERQPEALAAYQFLRDIDVVPCGFIPHPTIAMSGASPDGLVGEDGLVEFKCPASHTHIASLRGAPIAGEYLQQMLWQLLCTGRSWCDWVSFDPRLPARLQLDIRRFKLPTLDVTDLAEEQAREFLAEVDRAEEELGRMRRAA